LVGSCSITHSEITLSESILSSLLGTSYSGTKTGLITDHSFTFTNANGTTYRNSATIAQIAFASPPESISRANTSVTVNWTSALQSGETVTLVISDPPGSEVNRSKGITESSVNATSLTFNASELSELSNGTKKMVLSRTKTTDL